MRQQAAAVGSATFFALAPGVVAGVVPWWLTGWQVREPLPYWAPARVAGAALIAAGVVVLAEAFARFVVEGEGTPAPVAPTRRLVVGGLYRYVRNPMYLAVTAAITGQGLALGQLVLLAYAAVVWLTVAAFVHAYEEPTLSLQFGAQYEAYRRAVPVWWPRSRPWRPPHLNQAHSTGEVDSRTNEATSRPLASGSGHDRKGAPMKNEEKATWRDPVLGPPRELDLPQGRLRYFETGAGPPLVFAHGLLVNANLWRKVIAELTPAFRCIALDLPLGSHTLPMPEDADLTPHGLADLIAEAIESLALADVTLVGNDTGGALCQLVVTRRPERVGRLVLTSCDYRDDFPPAMFRYFKAAVAIPGAMKLLTAPMRLRAPRRLPFAFGWLVTQPIDRDAEDSYVLPGMTLRGVSRDFKRVVEAMHPRYTNESAGRLHEFDKPALIAWSRKDRLFKPAHARRLAADLPNARLEWIENARTFSPEDQPGRLAELIATFADAPRASSTASVNGALHSRARAR